MQLLIFVICFRAEAERAMSLAKAKSGGKDEPEPGPERAISPDGAEQEIYKTSSSSQQDPNDLSSEVNSVVDLFSMEESFNFCVYESDQEGSVHSQQEHIPVSEMQEQEEGELTGGEMSGGEDQHELPQQATPLGTEKGPSSVFPFLPLNLDGEFISWSRSYIAVDFFNHKGSCPAFELPELSRPPPAVPKFYGSILFQTVERYDSCPSLVLAEVSLNYRERERNAFNATRTSRPFFEHHNTRRGSRPFCPTCSEYEVNPVPIWHRHESSKLNRLRAEPDKYGRYECVQCEVKNHYFLPGGRTSVLVTSSTLNDYWGRKSGVPYVGDDLHLDVISVPGARLRDLNRAYRAEYSTHPLPVDCLVVAGFNDILNSQLDRAELGTHPEELEQLMQEATTRLTEDARALKQAVLNAHPPHQSNSVAFATLPVPPCLGWVDRANSVRAREQNFIRNQKISLLGRYNEVIREMNAECREQTGIDTVRAPSFRSWGLKRRPNSEGPLGPFAHRLTNFREPDPARMLHFSPYTKLKMGRSVGRYFKAIYSLAESVGDSKAEAAARRAALKTLPQYGGEGAVDRGIFWDADYDRCNPKDY